MPHAKQIDRPAHTPGPWEAEDRVERWVIHADHVHDFVATLPVSTDGVDDEATISAVEREVAANAHLVSAAPDLLEAVRRLVTIATMSAAPSAVSAVAFARHAIDKAVGR